MSNPTATPPEECQSLEEIRENMDALDRQIIAILALRVNYVKAAAKFKTSAALVADPDRVAKVLDTRRDWAEQAGLDGAVVRRLYSDIVAYCVGEERKVWEKSQGSIS